MCRHFASAVVAEAQGICADAEVDVLFPVKVPRRSSIFVLNGYGKTVVSVGYIGTVFTENILICPDNRQVYSAILGCYIHIPAGLLPEQC